MIEFFPIRFIPSPNPTDVVVLPSPAGVGLMAVTNISFALSRDGCWSSQSRLIFALSWPNGIMALFGISSFCPISEIGLTAALRAISISLMIGSFYGINLKRDRHQIGTGQ